VALPVRRMATAVLAVGGPSVRGLIITFHRQMVTAREKASRPTFLAVKQAGADFMVPDRHAKDRLTRDIGPERSAA
jgi:hypothetical protein